MVRAVVVEACGRRTRLRPRVDPRLTVVLGITSASYFSVHEPDVCPTSRALPCVTLVDWLLTRRQVLVEDEKVVAGVALGRVLPQFAFRNERVRAVDDDQLVEHLGVIHREDPG